MYSLSTYAENGALQVSSVNGVYKTVQQGYAVAQTGFDTGTWDNSPAWLWFPGSTLNYVYGDMLLFHNVQSTNPTGNWVDEPVWYDSVKKNGVNVGAGWLASASTAGEGHYYAVASRRYSPAQYGLSTYDGSGNLLFASDGIMYSITDVLNYTFTSSTPKNTPIYLTANPAEHPGQMLYLLSRTNLFSGVIKISGTVYRAFVVTVDFYNSNTVRLLFGHTDYTDATLASIAPTTYAVKIPVGVSI